MSLAIFDLDNTLIGGDSDHLWGEFLVENNLVDHDTYKQKNDVFYRQYQDGTLNILEYLEFALMPLAQIEADELERLHKQFMQEKIAPIMLPKAQQLVDRHRQAGDTLLIITATNRFITQPIATSLGIDNLLATEGEIVKGRYTGRVSGTPCFQEGKVSRLRSWLNEARMDLDNSYFYSDSANDIPLLECVTYPIAVDPDERLTDYAKRNNIPIISLR